MPRYNVEGYEISKYDFKTEKLGKRYAKSTLSRGPRINIFDEMARQRGKVVGSVSTDPKIRNVY